MAKQTEDGDKKGIQTPETPDSDEEMERLKQ